MTILEFVFSGFWHFVGSDFLLSITFEGIAEIVLALRGKP